MKCIINHDRADNWYLDLQVKGLTRTCELHIISQISIMWRIYDSQLVREDRINFHA